MPALFAALAFVLAAPPAQPTITLMLCDVAGTLRSDPDVLKREVETLLSGSGLRVRWKKVEAGIGFDSRADEVLVVLLPTQVRNPARERVLGLVIGNHRFPSPIWVSVPNVGFVAGVSPGEAPRSVVLETALGRVIAHEVVHAVVPDHPHATAGLMGRAVDRSTLTGAGGQLDQSCLTAMARALRDPRLRGRVSSPALSAMTAAP
jgi:hypothetical protein